MGYALFGGSLGEEDLSVLYYLENVSAVGAAHLLEEIVRVDLFGRLFRLVGRTVC